MGIKGLAITYGLLLTVFPSVLLISLGIWWVSNTVSHLFLHRPGSQQGFLNLSFSLYLSLLLSIPQSLWRDRHLAHHTDRKPGFSPKPLFWVEVLFIAILWFFLFRNFPTFFFTVYLPGFLIGLLLCHLQGYFEHWRGTTSFYGRVYNFFMLNDGYHVEHHLNPDLPWQALVSAKKGEESESRYPPLLRWFEFFSLNFLERLLLERPWLQRLVISLHKQAFQSILPKVGPVKKVAVVGGGLFPRSAIILKSLLPESKIVIIDKNAGNLEIALRFISGVELRNENFTLRNQSEFDLIVLPLAFEGERKKIYTESLGNKVLVHEWIWKRHAQTVVISPFLLKRLNLIVE